jgi:hypothetical protein
MMNVLLPEEYLESIWPAMLAFIGERVPLVRTHVLEFLLSFGKVFQSVRSPLLSVDIERVLLKYGTDSDPQVVALLGEARHLVGPTRVTSDAQALSARDDSPRLPRVFKASGTTYVARPPQVEPRAGPTSRRATCISRVPSPVVGKRTLTVGSASGGIPKQSEMTKSASNPAVFRLAKSARPHKAGTPRLPERTKI